MSQTTLLAAFLLVASLGKILDRKGVRQALANKVRDILPGSADPVLIRHGGGSGMARRFASRRPARLITFALLMTWVMVTVSSNVTHATDRSMLAPSNLAAGRALPAQGTVWVVAKADGSVVRSSGLTGLTRLSAGRYEARFTQDVRNCVYTATIGDPGNQLVFNPGLVFTAGGHLSADGVYIETKNLGGGLSDFPFHLMVTCAGSEHAVVDSSGKLLRGSALSVTKLGIGRYEVTFGSDVSKCGYTATIGDPGKQLVFNPGLVFTAGGHLSVDGIYVETKNLGGGLTDFPFHLMVSCAQDSGAQLRTSAIVRGDGVLVRGHGTRSVERLGAGRYEARFNNNVSGCTYTATIGDPGNQLVFNPGLVFTAGGHFSSTGVYVETKNLGGGLSDFPFHLYVDCSKRPLAEEGISVLNLNLEGTDTTLGPWRNRYARLASWMRSTQIIPDLLVFQETPASKCWFLGGCDPKDYESLFGLMIAIENATGIQYRVALLSTGASTEGWNPLYQGQAVLYNPVRLRNLTPTSGPIFPYDSLTPAQAFLVESYPCKSPPQNWRQLCSRVDTTRDHAHWGPHWAIKTAAFARFALTEHLQGSQTVTIDIYDIHGSPADNPDLGVIANAVDFLEQRLPPSAGERLFPPIMAGDFNATKNDMENEVSPGHRLQKFEIAAYPPAPPDSTEVIGMLVGKTGIFPSQFAAKAASNRFLPEGGPGLCGDPSAMWSDHCGQYVELTLIPR